MSNAIKKREEKGEESSFKFDVAATSYVRPV